MGSAEIASNDEEMVQDQKALCVHGYHVYKEICEAATSVTLVYVMEPGNSQDRNATAVEKRWESYWTFATNSVTIVHFFVKRGARKCSLC